METVPGPGRIATGSPIVPLVAAPPVGRRRRPSGEPPPLPRHIEATTRWYLGAAALTVALSVALTIRPVLAAITTADLTIIRAAARLRAHQITPVLRAVDALGSRWTVRVVAWATIVVLVVFRRFQHLAVYLLVVIGASFAEATMLFGVGRMRPAGVAILGAWDGYAFPSRAVAGLALVLAGVLYTIVPAGPWRNRAKWAAAVLIGALCVSELYLAIDHPSDIFAALVLGWAVPVTVFRLAVPGEAFPISYGGGRRAHLDVGGRRGEAIATALDHQLGLELLSIEPFGLEGSAGSTPLRLRVRPAGGTAETVLFGKLYALSHLRSDRWYKLTRTIVYGRLEDEKPFSTVRRLVEYEDHLLRLLRDAGLPTPRPYAFAEITPEREYLLVMGFFEGASEIGAVGADDADDALIDDALGIVRKLWDAGVAHRDIKPSNLLVCDGRVKLIDVAFAAVRPTPWRQAVDLANMMLTLALSTSPERVYERALRLFAPDDIAEAFAASRSVTIPTQLRARLRADGRDLIGCFRRLAPERRPVAIQLWSFQRVALTLGVVSLVLVALFALGSSVRFAGLL